jgi:hypothetical protein
MHKTAPRLLSLAVAVITAFALSSCGNEAETTLQNAAEELNTQLPIGLTHDITYDSAEAPGGKVLRYNYTLIYVASGDWSEEDIAAHQQERADLHKSQFSSDLTLTSLKDLDVTFQYRYHTNDGQELYTIVISPGDYKEVN